MERRDFMGAMLAIFGGIALPAPVIERVRLIVPAKPDLLTSGRLDELMRGLIPGMNSRLYPGDHVSVGARADNDFIPQPEGCRIVT